MKTAGDVFNRINDRIAHYYAINKKMPDRIYLDTHSFKLLYNESPSMRGDLHEGLYPVRFRDSAIFVVHTDITPYRQAHPIYAPEHIEVG